MFLPEFRTVCIKYLIQFSWKIRKKKVSSVCRLLNLLGVKVNDRRIFSNIVQEGKRTRFREIHGKSCVSSQISAF